MLRYRIPSAIVMVGGLVLLMWLDTLAAARLNLPPGTLLLLMLLLPFVVLAAFELEPILRGVARPGETAWIALGALSGLGVVALPILTDHLGADAPVLIMAAALTLLPVLAGWGLILTGRRRASATGVVARALSLGLGFLFLGLPAGAWLGVRWLEGAAVLVGAVAVVKVCDIGAYFTGRSIGRHKWIPWLSPGKTWEGLLGGVLTSAGIALLAVTLLEPAALRGWPAWAVAVAGGLLGLAGQLGDLFASALKRDAGVKDFASTIPGFGGVMDVADSLLLTGPIVLAVLLIGGQIAA